MKTPKPIAEAIRALLSGEWIMFLSMKDLVFFHESFLKKFTGHLQSRQYRTRRVFRILILVKSRNGLKCETRSPSGG